jgi:hypothetical protein
VQISEKSDDGGLCEVWMEVCGQNHNLVVYLFSYQNFPFVNFMLLHSSTNVYCYLVHFLLKNDKYSCNIAILSKNHTTSVTFTYRQLV